MFIINLNKTFNTYFTVISNIKFNQLIIIILTKLHAITSNFIKNFKNNF